MSRRTLHQMTQRAAPLQEAEAAPAQSMIEALAYEHWLARGCPIGSSEVDWLRAEEEVKDRIGPVSKTA